MSTAGLKFLEGRDVLQSVFIIPWALTQLRLIPNIFMKFKRMEEG